LRRKLRHQRKRTAGVSDRQDGNNYHKLTTDERDGEVSWAWLFSMQTSSSFFFFFFFLFFFDLSSARQLLEK
jgi:hypothetical protein